jgi:hypothetical protein
MLKILRKRKEKKKKLLAVPSETRKFTACPVM